MGGDHGRIRTATGQALDLLPLPDWATWPLVPPGGLEPPPHGLRTRHAALTPQRGIWFGLRVTIPSLHAGNVECSLHTQAEHGPVSFTGPSTSVSYQRTHSYELVGSKGFEPNRSRWENGVTARQRTIRSYRPLATAPGLEPGPTNLGGSDASSYTTLPLSPHVSTVSKTNPPRDLTHGSCRNVRPKHKRPSRGSP